MNISNNNSNTFGYFFKICIVVLLSSITIFIFFQLLNKEIRWPIGFLVVVGFVTAFVIVENKKLFLIALLFLGFSIRTSIFLWTPTSTFYLHGNGPGTAPELYAFDLPLLFLFLFSLIQKDKNKSVEFIKSDIASLFLLLFCALSFVSSEYRIFTFTGMLVIIRMPIIYYCFSRGITSEKDIKFVLWTLIFCVFIQSALGIAQTFLGSFSWLVRLVESSEQVYMVNIGKFAFGRPYGTIGYTTFYAQYLGLLFPLALASFLFEKTKWKQLISGFAYSLVVVALILSLSRAEWINLVVILILMFIMSVWKKQFQNQSVKYKFLIILFSVVLIGAIFSNRIILRTTMSDSGSAYSRILMDKVALGMIVHNPILGVGLNNYTEVMYQYGIGRLIPGIAFEVHNAFLLLGAEVGIMGLLTLLYLWGITYRRLIFCFRNDESYMWIISTGLICGLTALFIHSNVEPGFHVFPHLNGMLWSFFGIGAAMKIITVSKIEGKNPDGT
jgi:hypothetical protein